MIEQFLMKKFSQITECNKVFRNAGEYCLTFFHFKSEVTIAIQILQKVNSLKPSQLLIHHNFPALFLQSLSLIQIG
jgi:hypothetical protein